ncbi:hypothetical protein EZV73_09650 [Acidaminobacter sp. JC074]|uniref:hypothetical protein n=1 Tax=Acidaminobacter sp. JC074 TaxID=2530199 RepID=UPI001F0D990E|nr:hypothetical protein [Acidaminobacter sp. JC074]MCH4887837.1 hypothetical protein [Acidaminobacter sp. JC074]
MDVKLDQSLIDYMHHHRHNAITLSVVKDMINFHNVVYTKYPLINYKMPKHLEQYDEYQVGDISVYVSKEADVEGETIEFHDKKKWGRHKCYVEGIRFDKIDPFTH